MARRMARTQRVSKPSFCFVPFIFNLPESSGTLLLPQTKGVSLVTSLFSSLLHPPPSTCHFLFFVAAFEPTFVFVVFFNL